MVRESEIETETERTETQAGERNSERDEEGQEVRVGPGR